MEMARRSAVYSGSDPVAAQRWAVLLVMPKMRAVRGASDLRVE
jgi:hypothetical protein